MCFNDWEDLKKPLQEPLQEKIENSFDYEVMDHSFASKTTQQTETNSLGFELTDDSFVLAEKEEEIEDLQEEEEVKAAIQTLYTQQVAELQDTAKLGHRKRERMKPNKEARKAHNARIDKARMLTAKATADTLSVYDTVQSIQKEYAVPEEKRQEFSERALSNLRQSLTELQSNSFSSPMIREHFADYLRLVKDFEFLAGSEEMEELERQEIEGYRPLMEALRYRLQVYAEQNRIRLDGTVLGEKEAASRLMKDDVTSWSEMLSSYKEGKQFSDNLSDEEREAIRERKAEVARPQAVVHKGGARLTKEQSVTTVSDLKSQKKRDELRDLNFQLYNLGQKEVAGVIHDYVKGTRYAVGYTEERQRLVKARKAVEKALSNKKTSPEAKAALTEIKNYFSEMTNGTLEIPEDAEILDCTHDSQIEESGYWRGGNKRNAMIKGAKHWSDQKDTPLFSHEPVVNDLKQRLVSNCYMMAATAGIINISPELLKGCLKDNGNGTVTVRLFRRSTSPTGKKLKNSKGDMVSEMKTEFTPVYIKVKKTIPRIGSADALSAGTLWMQMIEKACAFYGRTIMEKRTDGIEGTQESVAVTGYRSLWYGQGDQFIERLLGVPSGKAVSLTTKKEQKQFFEDLLHIQDSGKVYSTGSGDRGASKGLDTGHAYSILGAEVINGQKYIRMRNPYSNHSLQYNKKGKHYKAGSLTSFSNGSDATYGQFLMKYDEFRKEFPHILVSDLREAAK